VARANPADDLSSVSRKRRDDELEAGVVMQGKGGVERAAQTFERRVAIDTQIALLVQIVDGDEISLASSIGDPPVVAAPTDGKVFDVMRRQAPTVGQRLNQPPFRKTLGRSSQTRTSCTAQLGC
jgi:hypothetical protein